MSGSSPFDLRPRQAGPEPATSAGLSAATFGFLTALLLVAQTLASPSLAAQGPEIRTRVDTTVLTVGDRVHLTLEVEHAPGATVEWPDSLDVRPFEVLEARPLEPVTEGGRVGSRLRLTLTTFELGELEIPPIPVRVVAPDGSETVVESDAWGVEVVSVGLDEGGSIRAIKGPLSIPLRLVSLLPLLLALLALAGAGWWVWRRRGGGEEETRASPILPRPPHEVAYEALDRLEAEDLPGRGEIKRFHVEISEIVRRYVESRFRIQALEMTTGELLAALGRRGVEGAVLEHVRGVLERCDLVKFAKHRPSAEASRELLPLARELVDESRSRVRRDGSDDAPPPVAPDGRPEAA